MHHKHEQMVFLLPTSWSTNSYSSAVVDGLPSGWIRVTIFVNGIPSPSVITSIIGYNQISGHLLSTGGMQLSFVGLAGMNYTLDRTFILSPANWVPQATNSAGPDGTLIFTNTPNTATNNFWHIRSAP